MAGEKDSAMIDVAFGKSKAPSSPEGDDGSSEDMGLKSAANAVFTALKGDDREGFASALHTYVKQCSDVSSLSGLDEEG